MLRLFIGIVFIALLAAVAAILVVPAKSPDVTFAKQESYPPFNEMIPVVIRDSDRSSDLYLVHPTVGTEVRLPSAGRNEELPIRSPSGLRLLFRSWEDPFWNLWLAESNGDETLLSESAAEPVNAVFSPDETKVILFEQEDGGLSASVIDLATKKRERAAKNVRTAVWLADNRGVALLTNQADGQDMLSVRLFGLDGSFETARDVTTGAWWLVGSRDSSRLLVFAKFDDGISLGEVSSEGTIERFADVGIPGAPLFLSGELSSDGTAILFTYETTEGRKVTQLYSLATKELTDISERVFDARFVGAYILMKEVNGNEVDVMLYDPRTRTRRKLTELEGITY